MPITIEKMSPADAHQRFADRNEFTRLYEEAYKSGSNLSHFLDKTVGIDKERGLDGFEQILAHADITTNTRLEDGIQADEVDKFLTEQNRALFPEYCARQWRKVSLGTNRGSDIYMSTDLNALLTGNVTGAAQTVRPQPLLEPAIPLADIVAVTTGISKTTSYEAQYMVEPAVSETRMVRITETSEIPRSKITTGKSNIRLYKYGRALQISYEELRRMRIDRLAFHIQRMAVQAEIDKAEAAIDVLINGDGNNNAATSTNISTLDAAATGGAMTVLGWLSWKVKRNQGAYRLTTVLVREATAVKILMLSLGTANIPFATVNNQLGIGGFVPMGNYNRTGDNVQFGVTDQVGATQIVGFDSRQALERVYEIGGNVSEVARYVNNQTELVTMTEVEGYAKIDGGAAWILNLA